MSSTEIRKAMEETSDLVRTIAWGLDFASEVPCMAPECSGPAAWALYKPCRHTILACDAHRAAQDEWFVENPGYHAVCLTCLDPVPMPLDWRPI